jgi:hypothetical protein
MRLVLVALILLQILVLVGSPAWRSLRCRRSLPLPRPPSLAPPHARRLCPLPAGCHRRHDPAPAERAPLA